MRGEMDTEKRDIARLYGQSLRDYLYARYNGHKGGWPGGGNAIVITAMLFGLTQNIVLSGVFLVTALVMCVGIKRPAQPYSEVTSVAFLWGCYGATMSFVGAAVGLYFMIMAFDSTPYKAWVTCPLIIGPWCTGQDVNREKFWLFYNLSLLIFFIIWFYAARQLPYRHNSNAPRLSAKNIVSMLIFTGFFIALTSASYTIAPENEISMGYRYGPAPFYSGVGVLYFVPYAILLVILFAFFNGLLGYVMSRIGRKR